MSLKVEDVLTEVSRKCALEYARESGLVGDVKLEVSFLTQPRENYLGMVYEVKAVGNNKEGDPKTVSMVLKRMVNDETAKASLQTTTVFSNEIYFYSETLPAFKDLQKKYGDTPDLELLDFVPKCIGSLSDGKEDFLMLENLKVSGFSMAPKTEGLDSERCKLVMRTLGKLHAFSYVMKDRDLDKFKEIAKSNSYPYFDPKKKAIYGQSFQRCAENAVEVVRLHSPEAAEKFDRWVSKGFFDNVSEVLSMEDDLSVITHGDCWTNNILFRGDPPTDVRFVDYQLMLNHSPAMDILYHLYTSLKKPVRSEYHEVLLMEYHESLKSSLLHLGGNPDVLPMEVLKERMKKYSVFGLGLAIILLPVVYGVPTEETVTSREGDAMARMVHNTMIYMKAEEMQLMMTGLVEEFIEKGYLTN